MGTIDFWNFLCAHVKYNHFKYTDQIWCYYHHYSPFYGWFYRIEIYSKYTGFARFWGGALSLNTNIFRTDAPMTLKFHRNTSIAFLWKVKKLHSPSVDPFWVIQNQKIGGPKRPPLTLGRVNLLEKGLKMRFFQLFFRLVHWNCLIFGTKVNLGNTYTLQLLK